MISRCCHEELLMWVCSDKCLNIYGLKGLAFKSLIFFLHVVINQQCISRLELTCSQPRISCRSVILNLELSCWWLCCVHRERRRHRRVRAYAIHVFGSVVKTTIKSRALEHGNWCCCCYCCYCCCYRVFVLHASLCCDVLTTTNA